SDSTSPLLPPSGFLPLPLFNQKKRNRVPLTSAPSQNEFFSHCEFTASVGSDTSHSTPGEALSSAHQSPVLYQELMDNRLYLKKYILGNSNNNNLNFNLFIVSMCTHQETIKPAFENSLRILTALIDGMRHWSQFKDKVPYLFEIFATLDSAVTLGHHGAKSFLMRDRKEVVQCVFYENEQELPRLIRGQVHRCIGNYDRSRDVLVCVSVRPAQPSELMNAQEAVKTCNAEMRALVGSFSEV
uniref:Uncharacterized protein n=1 Tax=Mola mola TaxID=94237 RepID=A0A3Q3W950_MOLML